MYLGTSTFQNNLRNYNCNEVIILYCIPPLRFTVVASSLHDVSSCYHTGYVVAGVMSAPDAATTEGVCPTGPPNGRVWYRLSVSVRRHLALLSLNGRELARVLPHHPAKGDAGLMMMNGFDNIVLIRGFSITQQPFGFSQSLLNVYAG